MRLLCGLLLSTLVFASPAMSAEMGAYRSARNAHGQPDFEGVVWSMNSMTRLERPAAIPNLVMTPEQVKIPPAQILPSDGVGTHESDPTDGFRAGWSRLGDEYRSSWIIEPTNGRLPYTDAGIKLMQARRGSDNPEARTNYERCLTTPLSGPPMINSAYNNNIQFVQTRDTIAMLLESNHEVRTVRLDTRKHGPVPQWFGDSVGWWEGETLVVETVNFTPTQSDRRASTTRLVMSPNAKVIERFTRISKDQIRYEFTVEDPEIFTQVWKGEMPMTITPEPTFEYACHEGNYGLTNILAGARYEEANAAKK